MAIIRSFFALFILAPMAFSQSLPVPVSDPYRTWATQKWGAAIVNDPAKESTVWGESANPDSDAYINLQEYSYDTDPRQPTLDPVVWSPGGVIAGFASLTYHQRVDDPALVVFPQYSEDMQSWWPEEPRDSFSWSGDGVFFRKAAESAILGGSRNVTQYCTIPLTDAPRLFIRLMVMRNHVQATGSPFDLLRFFERLAASSGRMVDSNSVLLSGFAGRIRGTVTGGAHLIVDGVDMGTTGEVAAGKTLRLQAMSPAGSATHTLSIGNFSTTWNVTTRSPETLSVSTGTVSGYTPVNASVTETGAAGITLPIAVPPGTGGMQPQLAITYSSQGGNGLVGVGFGIAGLSAVTRAPPTQYHDGVKGGIAFTPNDRFALDGQRLILAAGEWGGDSAEYRTEQESFSKITSHGRTTAGPLSWTIKMKNGNTFEYGASADSRVLAKRSAVPGDTAVLAWAVTRITDNVQNVIEFSYAPPDGTESGHPRIARISYTKNAAAGLAPGSEVIFEYEDRPDVRVNYVAGAKVEVRKRLSAIECRNGGRIARRYELTYQQAEISGNSQLIQVLEKGARPDNGSEWAAFAPTIFAWDQKPAPNMSLITPAQAPALGQMLFSRSPPSIIVEGDFNGDGRMDVMHFDDHGGASIWVASGRSDGTLAFATATGFTAADVNDYSGNTTYSRIRTGDFNGDGRTDVLQMNRSGTRNWLAISRGDGSFEVRHGPQLGALQGVGHSGDFKSEVITMDLTGDGRTDLVLLSAFGNNRVFLGAGDGSFSEVPVPANDPFRNFKISDTDSTNTFLVPGDFNGDGLGDILLLYNAGQHKLALSNGDGSFTVRASAQLGGINGVQFRRTRALFVSGDFNGDGLTDLSHFDEDGTAWLSFSKGDGAFETLARPPSIQGLALESQTGHSRLLGADFNGDGFADIFHAYYSASSRGWLASSKGDTSFAVLLAGQLGVLDGRSYEKVDNLQQTRLFTGDFDGDGTEDLLNLHYQSIGNGTASNFLARSNGFNADRVIKATNGHGAWTIFNYKPLTDPTVYLKGSGATYPNVDMIAPMHVVSSVITRNGVDGNAFIVEPNPAVGQSVTNYRYEGGWMCLDGRGFRGFSAMVVTSVETGITSRTEYELSDLDLSGRPAREVVTLDDGRIVNETLNTWTKQEFTFTTTTIGGQTRTYRSFFPYITESVVKEFEINNPAGAPPVKTTTTSRVAYDDFGNLTTSTTHYGSGFSEVTESSFTNDTTNWWLGRLRETTVRQTAPAANGSVSISRRSSFEYSDTTGQLTKETIETDDTNLRVEKTYVHDAFGNITRSTFKDLGTRQTRTTITRYTPDGRFIAETENHLGHIELKDYDPLTGAVTSQTGPNGLTTRWLRDGFGRPLREMRPDGTETITQYLRRAPGDIFPPRIVHYVSIQSSGGPWVYKCFDLLDREIGSLTPHFSGQVIATHQVYNSRGEVTHHSQPFITTAAAPTAPISRYTVSEFDAIGRSKKQTAPGTRVTSTAYAGLSGTVTNPKNQTFTRTSDVRGRTAASTSFGTDTVTNLYDPYGNLLRVDDGRDHFTTMAYDARGHKISISEPNSGTTLYTYNAFDELIEQTDALGRTTQLFYDPLGRLSRRIEPDENGYPAETIWEYDTAPHGKGKLARVYRLSDDYEESYGYDEYGRAVETVTRMGNMFFVSSTILDEYGRPSIVTYPTAFAIKNEYNDNGYLKKVRDAAGDFTYWTAVAFDDQGQLAEESFGNGLTTRRVFDPDTGLVRTIKTGRNLSASVQDLAYQFDPIGNLLERRDLNRGVFETFDYDGANQLAGITSNAADPITIACDRSGNILRRSDLGAYSYGENGAGPHAVTTITDNGGADVRHLRYDAAGNCVENGDTTLRYTANNQPAEIRNADATLIFFYTPSRARYRLIQRGGSTRTEKIYIGGLYERQTNDAGIAHIHFIPAAGSIVAIHTQTQTLDTNFLTVTASKTRYVHKDHLGSIQALTREDAGVDEVLDFDAWGRRRTFDATTHRYTYASVTSQTDRGFTGHEMLDAVGLIHMNGRVYDPTLGRFLSADPLVQEPENLQNLNRYTYVLNNPLSLTDPSGFGFLGKIGKWFAKNWKQIVSVGVTIAVGVLFPEWAVLLRGFAAGFGGAFTGTLLSGGTIGDALRAGAIGGVWGALSAGVANRVGGVFAPADPVKGTLAGSLAEYPDLKPIVHGVTQGGISAAQGGKLAHGFLSAFAASQFEGAANWADTNIDPIAGHVVAAVVGGTAESLGGGKFANGAVTGAFMDLYNRSLHDRLRAVSESDEWRSAKELVTNAGAFIEGELEDVPKAWGNTIDYALKDDPTGSARTWRGFRRSGAFLSKTAEVIEIGEPLLRMANDKLERPHDPNLSWKCAFNETEGRVLTQARENIWVRGIHYTFTGRELPIGGRP